MKERTSPSLRVTPAQAGVQMRQRMFEAGAWHSWNVCFVALRDTLASITNNAQRVWTPAFAGVTA